MNREECIGYRDGEYTIITTQISNGYPVVPFEGGVYSKMIDAFDKAKHMDVIAFPNMGSVSFRRVRKNE